MSLLLRYDQALGFETSLPCELWHCDIMKTILHLYQLSGSSFQYALQSSLTQNTRQNSSSNRLLSLLSLMLCAVNAYYPMPDASSPSMLGENMNDDPQACLPQTPDAHSAKAKQTVKKMPHSLVIQIFDDLHNHRMILVLLQAAHHHHTDNTLDPHHPNRHSAPLNRILPPTLPQSILARKRLLVPLKLAPHVPRADAPPQHRLPLAPHPQLVVGRGARLRGAAEERLARVGEGYVDDDGNGKGKQAGAQGAAEIPGVSGGELLED